MTAALELTDVTVDIAGRRVVDMADLRVSRGEVVGLLGANGCGKTTLLRAALGLTRVRRGETKLAGRAVDSLREGERARLTGYLPQERRVGWNLTACRVAALGVPHLPPARARDVALAALADVEMSHLAERGVLDMSGGERARVLLARLLATGAPLLIADEPAAGLDPDAQLLVMDILRARAAAGIAVLVTLHDLNLAARGCDRLAVMAEGRVVADGPPRTTLTPKVLREAFGVEGELIERDGVVVRYARGPSRYGGREIRDPTPR